VKTNKPTPTDLFIIGGGINGCGIAADAAGRGLSVTLCEQNDLASGTSSASTKLIHGGLRYLELYEFNLVRKALKEREVLLKKAPHIISPMRFVMPHVTSLRPAWLIRLGLFIYDHISRRTSLPGSKRIDFANHPSGHHLQQHYDVGFEYSDCWVDDARLVVLNALQARELGADILTRCCFKDAKRHDDHWDIRCETQDGEQRHFRARTLINASGPWINQTSQHMTTETPRQVRLVKGSHIIVPKLFDHPYAYILQNPDGRIIFAIPFENKYTLIGTTDVDYQGALEDVAISDEEIDYLCKQVNAYFKHQITRRDVIWHYAGIRPLLDEPGKDPKTVSRDYHLALDTDPGAPLLTVHGGKITTYRLLAEEALSLLSPFVTPHKPAWTATQPLPGAFKEISPTEYAAKLQQQYPWLPKHLSQRYAEHYGTLCEGFLRGKTQAADLGENIHADLFAAEVDYLREHEWAQTADDILWRRSKLGLQFDAEATTQLEAYLKSSDQTP
jgi:glycerol-3-phosphate dehydrogenase